MADLLAYQNINIELDFVSNQIKVTDPNGYPSGVANNLVGVLNITQPDNVRIQGSFGSPDIIWSGSGLSVASKALRLNSQGNPQEGTYVVEYQIDHPDYTPTTITKTFILSYVRKTLSLVRDFDVFTPSLFYRDNTSFSQAGFNLTANTVAWTATIGTVGTVNGAASDFDLAFGGEYYDAVYDINYQRNVLYQHATYAFLTLRDRYSKNIDTTADTPPTTAEVINCIDALKDLLNAAAGNCTSTTTLEGKYQKAMARYDHLLHKLGLTDLSNAEVLLQEIIDLTGCVHDLNRNEVIEPYVFPSCCSGSGGGSSTVVPNDIEFTVATGQYMEPGDTAKTITSLIGYRIRFRRNGLTQSTSGSTSSYTWDKTTGGFTCSPALSEGEEARFEPYDSAIGTPEDIDVIVNTGEIIEPGDAGATLTSLIGYRLRFSRNGARQSVTGSTSSYTWNSTTGAFTGSPAFSATEELKFEPY